MVTATGAGKVINMSSSGIAFTGETIFTPGTLMELSVGWPVLLQGEIAMKLVIKARVVWSERQVTALEILQHEFRTQRK